MKLNVFGYFSLVTTLALAHRGMAVGLHDDPSTIQPAAAPARTIVNFDFDWRFSKGEFATACMPVFDDSGWRHVNVPHDWSIEGPFSPKYASGTGYAPGGIGWYRKHFQLPAADRGKIVTIEFGGVYDFSEVWINGVFVGRRPYGYSSFAYNLTPYLHFGTNENVIAVRVDHSRYADSRWYTGSGIYRHVRLCITSPLHVAHWGTYVTTPKVSNTKAVVRIETTVENSSNRQEMYSLESDILAPGGQVVARSTTTETAANGTEKTVVQELKVSHPQLWSVDSPTLYTLRSQVLTGKTVKDQTSTIFGIRTAVFDPDKGFLLNGHPMKLKGVCLHHDAGCLGAAVPDKVWERRLRLLKGIGVNAIRTSHNPPAPEFLDLCDRLGFLVMDEAFDEFGAAKNKWIDGRNVGVPSHFGYAEVFKQWSVTDIKDMVRRDRNHPCVILWSIGNEIDYPNDAFTDPVLGKDYEPGHPPAQDIIKYARPLIAAVKSLDRTRPVTAALASLKMSEAIGYPELLDAVGYNYQEYRYASDHKKFPKRIIFGSETHQSYAAWEAVKTNAYVAGQFLWTGIDYLGEAGRWPNRGSGTGLLDLCGFKKPLGWFRQSLWSDKPMVYLCVVNRHRGPGRRRFGFRPEESWNWPSNAFVTVICFANCPQVTLMLNHHVIGTKQLSEATNGRLFWRLPYEPGALKAVGSGNGKELCEYVLKTAGPARRIELLPDTTKLQADGEDICHLEFRIVDDRGVRVPDANPEVTFTQTGPVRLLGIGNGNLNSPEPYQGPTRKAYHGRGLAIFESTLAAGKITIKATAPNLEPATVQLKSVKDVGDESRN